MISDVLNKILNKENLSQDESKKVMMDIMEGKLTSAQLSAYLVALRAKGETVDEITGMALAMREKAHKIKTKDNTIDTCGTGGDMLGTFNISTATAFVVAGAGIPVAKHGNRSVSSFCGSADILEALGIKIDLQPEIVEKCIDEVGIGFLFAPVFHPAMRFASPTRKEIGIRTVFNILGPLCNPAQVKYQLVGVYQQELVEKLAYTLKNLGCISCYVVSSNAGEDEISIISETKICELRDGIVSTYTISPEDFGINRVSFDKIKGGDANYNANVLIDVLKGVKNSYRDAVILNSAFAISLITKDVKEGLKLATESIDSGKAYLKMKLLKEYTSSIN